MTVKTTIAAALPPVHDNWRTLLTRSITAWLGYLLVLINALDASYWFFIGYAPVPQWVMGLMSAAIGLAIPYARIIIQKRISNARK